MKKQLNTESITNELRQGSVFFRPPLEAPNEKKPVSEPEQPEITKPDPPAAQIRTEKRSKKRTPKLPVKRITKRYSFEFYEDQLIKIKQLVRDAEDRGDRITQSVIVRAALDLYLKNK